MNIIIVVGLYQVVRAFLEERARGAALRGERFSHRFGDGTLTIGDHTRYISVNGPERLGGLTNVIDVVALYGADERAVAEAWRRAAMHPAPRPQQRVPAPPVVIDTDALWSMGVGERADVLRGLGRALRPFCPAATDELETYDGGAVEPPPEPTITLQGGRQAGKTERARRLAQTMPRSSVRFDDGTVTRPPDRCTCWVDQGAIRFSPDCLLHFREARR